MKPPAWVWRLFVAETDGRGYADCMSAHDAKRKTNWIGLLSVFIFLICFIFWFKSTPYGFAQQLLCWGPVAASQILAIVAFKKGPWAWTYLLLPALFWVFLFYGVITEGITG
jgi:hypothetical protein